MGVSQVDFISLCFQKHETLTAETLGIKKAELKNRE